MNFKNGVSNNKYVVGCLAAKCQRCDGTDGLCNDAEDIGTSVYCPDVSGMTYCISMTQGKFPNCTSKMISFHFQKMEEKCHITEVAQEIMTMFISMMVVESITLMG